MLSIGSIALAPDLDESLIDSAPIFTANLKPLSDAQADPDTMAWWGRPENHDAWTKTTRDRQEPEEVMLAYVRWLDKLPGIPIFVGYPAGFDFTFVYYYIHRFAYGNNPFVRNVIDVESFVMPILKTTYLGADQKHWPKEWISSRPHTHVAIDDAIHQGISFLRMLRASRGTP
jgi:hypothetical protein